MKGCFCVMCCLCWFWVVAANGSELGVEKGIKRHGPRICVARVDDYAFLFCEVLGGDSSESREE